MDTSNLHYSYPDFNKLNSGNLNAVREGIARSINKLYGGGQTSLRRSITPGVNLLAQPPATGGGPVVVARDAPPVSATQSSVRSAAASRVHHVKEGVHAIHAAAHGESEPPTVIYDWSARIHAKKYELGHGYIVLIFLGPVPDDPSKWRTSSSFVGAHVAFVNTEAEQCDNCRDQAELVVEGFVHLNAAIARLSGLSSFDPSVVTPYLRDNLHWRVQGVSSLQSSLGVSKSSDIFHFDQVDRRPVQLERLTSLEVTAVSNTLTHEPGALFPIAGPALHHHHITHGRLGGARHAHA